MGVALIAAFAMVLQDILGSILVMAEAANKGWLAGFADTLGWYTGIATTFISVDALNGHNTATKVYVLVFVGAANLLGTKLGVASGNWLLNRKPSLKAVDPLVALAERVAMLENKES